MLVKEEAKTCVLADSKLSQCTTADTIVDVAIAILHGDNNCATENVTSDLLDKGGRGCSSKHDVR